MNILQSHTNPDGGPDLANELRTLAATGVVTGWLGKISNLPILNH